MGQPVREDTVVRAWDFPTRAFHWTLVLLVLMAYVSYRYAEALGDPTMLWHRLNGYAILILVVWRLGWGLFGSSTARFSHFLKLPHHALHYGFCLARGRAPHYLGHNPLGAYMIVALLAMLAAQGILGLLSEEHNQTTWGPLYFLVAEERRAEVTRWHGRLFWYGLLVLVGLHILANVLYGLLRKDPLIAAMITGRKPTTGDPEGYADGPEAIMRPRPILSALVWLAISTAILLGVIKALGGQIIY
ncbi:MAG: cytochrome b/b6 domain-containing protein [Hyphomicrobiaceae bacterium]